MLRDLLRSWLAFPYFDLSFRPRSSVRDTEAEETSRGCRVKTKSVLESEIESHFWTTWMAVAAVEMDPDALSSSSSSAPKVMPLAPSSIKIGLDPKAPEVTVSSGSTGSK